MRKFNASSNFLSLKAAPGSESVPIERHVTVEPAQDPVRVDLAAGVAVAAVEIEEAERARARTLRGRAGSALRSRGAACTEVRSGCSMLTAIGAALRAALMPPDPRRCRRLDVNGVDPEELGEHVLGASRFTFTVTVSFGDFTLENVDRATRAGEILVEVLAARTFAWETSPAKPAPTRARRRLRQTACRAARGTRSRRRPPLQRRREARPRRRRKGRRPGHYRF